MAERPVDAALRRIQEFTPKTGFNVVGVDTYEEPGEELYLVGHYQTREEAEAAIRRAEARAKKIGSTPERHYIYAAPGT